MLLEKHDFGFIILLHIAFSKFLLIYPQLKPTVKSSFIFTWQQMYKWMFRSRNVFEQIISEHLLVQLSEPGRW